MEPKRTFMKKAKIELFSNCFAGLSKQNELKNYFKANNSMTSKCAHLVETGLTKLPKSVGVNMTPTPAPGPPALCI